MGPFGLNQNIVLELYRAVLVWGMWLSLVSVCTVFGIYTTCLLQ